MNTRELYFRALDYDFRFLGGLVSTKEERNEVVRELLEELYK